MTKEELQQHFLQWASGFDKGDKKMMLICDDPWTVPQPSLRNGDNAVKLEERYTWYALLHMDTDRVHSCDVEQTSKRVGYPVSRHHVAWCLKRFWRRGYFDRFVFQSSGAGTTFYYVATGLFRRVQNQWRQGI